MVADSKTLDAIDRNLSFGSKTDIINLVDEDPKAKSISFTFANTSAANTVITLAPMISSGSALNPSLYNTKTELLAAAGAGALAYDGALVTDVTCTALDGITMDRLIRHFAKNPTRITKLTLKSSIASTGAKDTTNFDNKIRTIFMNPFEDNVSRDLPLVSLQKGELNFNPDMMKVDLIDLGFPVVLSSEHLLNLQVNADTKLTVTFHIGAFDSDAQRFWRNIRKADNVIRRRYRQG